jgi:hypothetical protein
MVPWSGQHARVGYDLDEEAARLPGDHQDGVRLPRGREQRGLVNPNQESVRWRQQLNLMLWDVGASPTPGRADDVPMIDPY